MTATFKTILKVSIILIMVTNLGVMCRPGEEWVTRYACETDKNLKEMCQRCAKQTKSNLVYPMCCNKEDEVHNWCKRYTTFGKEA